jgi:dihydroorotate dehydrogenase (fumarate)
MDLTTKLGVLTLKNPLLPGSGPLTGDDERMIYLAGLGVGALVSKTIAPEGANVGRPCICGGKNVIFNSELWSEYPAGEWIGKFLPRTRARVDIPIIVSVGYNAEDMNLLVPRLEPFADAYEVIPRYASKDLVSVGQIMAAARKLTARPIWVKMNANLPDPVEFARVCRESGADGVVAIASLGPNMVIDLRRRRPLIGTELGYVWTSGPSIKPLALATVDLIRQALPEISIIGSGGISTADDVLEFLLAGADAVEMLSAAMLRGKDTYAQVIAELPAALERYGFTGIEDVKRTGLARNPVAYEPSFPEIDGDKCTGCRLCERNCPYFAMSWSDDRPAVNREKCFGCGLCESRCPAAAISGVL